MENNNFTAYYQYKEVALDDHITLFSVDVNDRESIER
jgi:hypothetical protein